MFRGFSLQAEDLPAEAGSRDRCAIMRLAAVGRRNLRTEMRFLVLLAIVVVVAALDPLAQTTRTRIDVSKLGPQVGQQVPDFSLPDQTGRTRNLQSIMGRRGAMLVFLRSADW